jgi:hypothetical protein
MIHIIDNFLSPKECSDYITLIDTIRLSKDKHVPFTNNASNFNHKYVDLVLSEHFYKKLIDKWPSAEPIGPNNLIMISRYNAGENFGIHTDTGLFYDKLNRIKTRYTMLIYLNDDFTGGNTVFYDTSFNVTRVVVPKKGSCLVFDIDLWHEGREILNGNKYWIGIELIGNF